MKPAAPPPPDDALSQLTEIRAIMERSTRFISLSGLSGVGAGLVALAGAGAAYGWLRLIYDGREGHDFDGTMLTWLARDATGRQQVLGPLLLIAGLTIGAAVLVAAFFTLRRTRRAGLQALRTAPARRFLLALLLPLGAGALFCLKLYLTGVVELVVPGLLTFYGLALLNASKYTLDEIRYLGLTLLGLGALGLLLPGYGLALFALGFGLGHIGYGVVMYRRYERGRVET